METIQRIREFLKGRKSYIVAVTGLVGAVVAWSEGQLDGAGLWAAVWLAAQAVALRAGIGATGGASKAE